MLRNATTRTVAVINSLLRAGPAGVGVRELAGQLLLSRSATHRVLATLAELGAARSLDGGRYEATATIRAWGTFMATRHPVLRRGREVMSALAQAAGENIHMLLATPDPATGVFVATAPGPNPIQHSVTLGAPSPTTEGAAGKALLSSMPASAIDQVLAALAQRDPGRAATLAKELLDIRRVGYATSRHELLADIAGVAAPFSRNGEPYGALTVSMPEYRRTAQTDEHHIALLLPAAARLSEQLDERAGPGSQDKPTAAEK
jgi:DNA-binding IclR family transcriptional regulator